LNFLCAATTVTNGGTAIQSVDYRPSGVILELRPIVREEVVDLDVRQQISSFAATTTGVNNTPTLLKRELQTMIGVRPGETIVLGGLEDTRDSDARAGLAWRPRLFDSTSRTRDRVEVLLVLDVQRVGS
jgi:type II secretory pathway component GspD/PulD (secretin)